MVKKTKAAIKQEALEIFQLDIAREFIRDMRTELDKIQGRLNPQDIPTLMTQFVVSIGKINEIVSDTEDSLAKISAIIGEQK